MMLNIMPGKFESNPDHRSKPKKSNTLDKSRKNDKKQSKRKKTEDFDPVFDKVSDQENDSYGYYSETEVLSTALNETVESPSANQKQKTKKTYTGKDG